MIADIDVKYKDYAIGGKLITAHVTVEEQVYANELSDHAAKVAMRRALVEEIVSAMLNNRLVQIMQQKDPLTGTVTIAARAYVAPDETVKLLRKIDNE
jgi:hypothetical protein